MKRISKKPGNKKKRGDSIVEVLIATAIISLILATAYSLTTHNTNVLRDTQERAEALGLASSQLESLRANQGLDTTVNNCFSQTGTAVTAAGGHCAFNSQGASPCTASYCYDVKIVALDSTTSGPSITTTYKVTVQWPSLLGGTSNQDLEYRLSRANPAYSPPPPPSSCPGGPDSDVALVLDASSSMNEIWQGTTTRAQKLAAATSAFIDSTQVSAANNHEALIQFNSAPSVLTNFTSSPAALHSALAGYHLAVGTRFTPALQKAADLYAGAAARPASQKVVVLISDGLVLSPDTPALAIAKAQELKNAGAKIYTILIMDPSDPDYAVASNTMQSVAGNGGSYGNASFPAQLDAIMSSIAASVNISC